MAERATHLMRKGGRKRQDPTATVQLGARREQDRLRKAKSRQRDQAWQRAGFDRKRPHLAPGGSKRLDSGGNAELAAHRAKSRLANAECVARKRAQDKARAAAAAAEDQHQHQP
jgi:hypothetical protein